jgi:predicted metal-dependent peptidase
MIAIVGDTSGSCDNHQAEFCQQVSDILSTFQTTTLFLEVDAMVHEPVKEYRSEDLPIEFSTRGGGGTNFRPAFEYIEKHGHTPACLIYLTDLYGTFPKEPPEYPVMWVCVNKEVAPFGETVHMPLPQ